MRPPLPSLSSRAIGIQEIWLADLSISVPSIHRCVRLRFAFQVSTQDFDQTFRPLMVPSCCCELNRHMSLDPMSRSRATGSGKEPDDTPQSVALLNMNVSAVVAPAHSLLPPTSDSPNTLTSSHPCAPRVFNIVSHFISALPSKHFAPRTSELLSSCLS